MEMQPPTKVPEFNRFTGMVNQLGKFTPSFTDLTQPLRELLSKSKSLTWGGGSYRNKRSMKSKKSSLSPLRLLITTQRPDPTKISADSSSYGLGAVLLQQLDSQWEPIAYASRSMSKTEKRYTQIEKALASTWACEKFSTYILGKKFTIKTDHKPLVPLLGVKHLDSLLPRTLRFRIQLTRFDYDIEHVPGKHLYTVYTPPLLNTGDKKLTEAAVDAYVANLPASEERLKVLQDAHNSDPVCLLVMKYCRSGWPIKDNASDLIRPFWEVREHLTLHKNSTTPGLSPLILCSKNHCRNSTSGIKQSTDVVEQSKIR